MVATLADVPLAVRVRGALAVVTSELGLDVAGRYAIVAAAIWPDPVATPTEVARPKRWPSEVRISAVAAYQAGGASYAVVGERFGVPAATVKDWVKRGR